MTSGDAIPQKAVKEMAGRGIHEGDSTELQNRDCSFIWDPQTGLYFHASSGFYHDPDAGWYYSSRDGLYYKFEDGNYVLLNSECKNEGVATDNPDQNEICGDVYDNFEGIGDNARVGDVGESGAAGQTDDSRDNVLENPQPPSEWLEDTLIDLYLSGYCAVNCAADTAMNSETDITECRRDQTYEIEEGEWIPEENYGLADSSEVVPYEGMTWDEENWRAQYGQVTQSEEEDMPEFPAVDLWDWEMATRPRKDGKGLVARLMGRLVKRSAKVHPSMPSGGGLLKTAPICEVHLDLVRVRTGQVYKLRSPSPRYLASLSTYDSSNPTRDWGFPEFSVSKPSFQSKCVRKHKSEASEERVFKHSSILSDEPSTYTKPRGHVYRDRAAERRTLHGGFGLGPGQKDEVKDDNSECIEDAKAEALNLSFGAGSYARRIIEGMGWKEGEALGRTTNGGLKEPLQLNGNIGNAGLGWPQTKCYK